MFKFLSRISRLSNLFSLFAITTFFLRISIEIKTIVSEVLLIFSSSEMLNWFDRFRGLSSHFGCRQIKIKKRFKSRREKNDGKSCLSNRNLIASCPDQSWCKAFVMNYSKDWSWDKKKVQRDGINLNFNDSSLFFVWSNNSCSDMRIWLTRKKVFHNNWVNLSL